MAEARREAARRCESECKVNLLSQNSSRSNDSWRILDDLEGQQFTLVHYVPAFRRPSLKFE